MYFLVLLGSVVLVRAGSTPEAHKDQFCTDPRTMQKHQAYTEWADAYSCTRHRCQPGGRNLAIYTVGCKRVEAPESAIECEEVVEDTNMQFPFCCTRLRCLVVVRGEVWTRVLGQPWETLSAAPWSHMYKMKKPPPGDNTFLPKQPNEGPVYELSSDVEGEEHDKVMRSKKKPATEPSNCNEAAPRALASPDIVIALSTNNEKKDINKEIIRERSYKQPHKKHDEYYEEVERSEHHNEIDTEDSLVTEKPSSDEKVYMNAYGVTQKPFQTRQHSSWTESPSQWNDENPDVEQDGNLRDTDNQSEFPPIDEQPSPLKDVKPTNLQALVDAIGSRMRDIEHVVQRMSLKVHQAKSPGAYRSAEKRSMPDNLLALPSQTQKHHKVKKRTKDLKKPIVGEHNKRFSIREGGSKYLHSNHSATEPPAEDASANGYFSDASNTVSRRYYTSRKEPQVTYMAPVENRRKATHTVKSQSEELEKHKKHSHKRRKNVKGKGHRRHNKDDKKKHSKLNSVEANNNIISLEDSAILSA